MYVQDSIFGAIGVFVTFFVLGGGITYIMRRYLKSRYPNFVKKFKNFGKTEIMFLLTFISVGFYQAVLVYSQIPVVIPLVVKSISLIIGTYTFYLIVNHLIKLWRDFWQKDERLKVRIKSIMVTRRVIRMILFVGCIILVLNTWYVKTFPVFMAIIDFINTNSFTKTIMIFVTYAVIAKTIHYISKTYITEAIRKHEEGLGDLILEKIEAPISWIIIFYGLKMTFVFINFTSWYSLQAINTVIAVIVMHTFIVLTDVLIEHLEKKWKARTNAKFDDEILIIAHNGAKILIIMIGILLILYVWGVEIKSMLLSLGVLGVVVGFALKDSLDNLAGGISLMLDRSFRTGDMVRLESGEIGSVVDIGLRSTRIKTLDSELLTVPNGQLANTKFVNYAKPNNMLRIKIPVAVEYGSDPDKVKKVLRKCARSFSMRKDETSIEVRFLKMADFSLEFELLFYIKTYKDRYKAVNKMTTKVYKELKKNKIGIPFPTRTIYMKNKRKR